jgi:membrane AbrB-like protein
MIAAIVVGVAEGTIRVPRPPFIAAQSIIGCLIGHTIPLSIVEELIQDWPLFLMGVVSVIVASSVLGWLLTRWSVLPGTTAIWGTSAGASTAMILMSEAYGADPRLVAVMQYLRVVIVVLAASLVARIWTTKTGTTPEVVWFPSILWAPFLGTLALAACGAVLATLLNIPAGALLLPLAATMILQALGWRTIELPPWLLAIGYALVGWSIGLRFTRPIFMYAARALPQMLLSIFALIAICGLIAAVLVAAGIDPLTAYLATSPGGADSVAIIAASSNVDLRFVMAMQTARLLVVLLTGPSIARFITWQVGGRRKPD